jgi:hypothetical protein
VNTSLSHPDLSNPVHVFRRTLENPRNPSSGTA